MPDDQSAVPVSLLRPIIGIENRTAQEVFDIMGDRIRHHGLAALAPSGHIAPDGLPPVFCDASNPIPVAFAAWEKERGVWPRVFHDEAFRAGWEAALASRDAPDASGQLVEAVKALNDAGVTLGWAARRMKGKLSDSEVTTAAVAADETTKAAAALATHASHTAPDALTRLKYDAPQGSGRFELHDQEPDNHHSALYLADPNGALFNISYWDEEGLDIERGKWMVAVLNAALATPAPSRDEVERVRNEIINTPETADFMAGVPIEATHQRERWAVDHDAGKSPFDWFWLIGYLAQKAASSAVAGDSEKAKHHTISTAAALANWHAALTGADTRMRPGTPLANKDTGDE